MSEFRELIAEPHRECPFCDNQSVTILSREIYEKLYKENGSATMDIHCDVCGLDLFEHSVTENNYKLKRAILLDKWNHRIGV